MKVYFDTPLGIKFFRVVGDDYFSIHKVYPQVSTELPKYLNNLGYNATFISGVKLAHVGNKVRDVQRIGVDIPDDELILFRLRYNI